MGTHRRGWRAGARTTVAAAVLAVLVAVLAGCSGDSGSDATGDSGASHNDADVAFATEMIPHHAQALVMVDMADDVEVSPETRELMDAIEAAQGPEIDQMAGWLEDWDEEVPPTDWPMGGMGGTDGMDHGGMGDGDGLGMGMMSEEDLEALRDRAGSAFERMWLRMMIEHHEGAIEMSQTEKVEGEFPDAIELAESIITSQQAEIETMEQLLER